jgi:hypothetical protein
MWRSPAQEPETVSDEAAKGDQDRVMRTKHSCPNDRLTVDEGEQIDKHGVRWQLREGDQRIAALIKIARALLHTARPRSCGGAVPHVHGRGRVAFADPVEADWRAAEVVIKPDALAEQGCVPRADLNREPSE